MFKFYILVVKKSPSFCPSWFGGVYSTEFNSVGGLNDETGEDMLEYGINRVDKASFPHGFILNFV